MPTAQTVSRLLRKIALSTDILRLDLYWTGAEFDYEVPDRGRRGRVAASPEGMPSPADQIAIVANSDLTDLLDDILHIELNADPACRVEVNYNGSIFRWTIYRKNITADSWSPSHGYRRKLAKGH